MLRKNNEGGIRFAIFGMKPFGIENLLRSSMRRSSTGRRRLIAAIIPSLCRKCPGLPSEIMRAVSFFMVATPPAKEESTKFDGRGVSRPYDASEKLWITGTCRQHRPTCLQSCVAIAHLERNLSTTREERLFLIVPT
jgi:hypothetical protein